MKTSRDLNGVAVIFCVFLTGASLVQALGTNQARGTAQTRGATTARPSPSNRQELFDLSIIHANDFHARFEPTNVNSGSCRQGENEQGLCYGGIARLVTAIRQRKETLPNPVLLNAGDNFQGSLLYTLFKWNITVEFMNLIDFDATALGNHEFDDGVAGVAPYMEQLHSPLLAANLDASREPLVQGKFQPSRVIERGGRKIGIVGFINQYTNEISNTGNLRFLDETTAVIAEAAKLKAQGVDIIIGLSHSGFDVDLKVAQAVPDLDIIVGGHSHTFLYTGTPLPSTETPFEVYPKVVTQLSGRKVLVVQAYAYSKYLGVLSTKFDAAGELVSWSGNPVLLDKTVTEDATVKSKLKPWVDAANEIGQRTLGLTAVFLDQTNSACYQGECNLGSFLTDAMVAEYAEVIEDDSWATAAIALINPGGLRASMGETPNITYNDLVTAQPFLNTIDTIDLKGKDIIEILELAATKPSRTVRSFPAGRGCLQVSGIQATYNASMPEGSRVIDVSFRCAKCRVPVYLPVNMEQYYTVAMPSFLSNGGDGYSLIVDRGRNKKIGPVDVDVFMRHIARSSPITQGIDGRIKVID